VRGIYGGQWAGPVFVLTTHPEDAPEDAAVTVLSDGLEEAVATARDAAGAKNVQIFGANLAHQWTVELDGGVPDLRYTVPKSK
jgi:dihydrofolate reductase